MRRKDILSLSLCILLASCASRGQMLDIDESKYAGYLVERNEMARKAGFAIGIEIIGGQIYVPDEEVALIAPGSTDLGCAPQKRKCALGELDARIKKSIAARGIADCGRVPVCICTYGQVKFGQVASIFDICSGHGFKIIGFYSMDKEPPLCDPKPIKLPFIQNGEVFDANARYENCVEVKIDSGGHIAVDGDVILEGKDRLASWHVFRQHLKERFRDSIDSESMKNLVCLIYADKDADVAYVDHVAFVAKMVCRHVAMVGISKGACKYIWFTTPVPDGTYWNYDGSQGW